MKLWQSAALTMESTIVAMQQVVRSLVVVYVQGLTTLYVEEMTVVDTDRLAILDIMEVFSQYQAGIVSELRIPEILGFILTKRKLTERVKTLRLNAKADDDEVSPVALQAVINRLLGMLDEPVVTGLSAESWDAHGLSSLAGWELKQLRQTIEGLETLEQMIQVIHEQVHL